MHDKIRYGLIAVSRCMVLFLVSMATLCNFASSYRINSWITKVGEEIPTQNEENGNSFLETAATATIARTALEPTTTFVDAEYFEEHSSTLKIINGTFRNVFTEEFSDEDDSDDKMNYSTSKDKRKVKLDSPKKTKRQLHNTKKLEQCRKPGFVPCYVDERKMRYPKSSVLNKDQQDLLVKLMVKYKNFPECPTPLEKVEWQQMEKLLKQISSERLAFDCFTKSQCGLNHDRYTFIKPDVKRYIDELWKHKISQISRYPQSYESYSLLPLVYPARKDRIVLCLKQELQEMGNVPVVHLPYLRKATIVMTSYARMCTENPIDDSAFQMPVSEDPDAEKLAKVHHADVVISLSGLKNIMNNFPPYEKNWDLPVVIKEYPNEEQGKSTRTKVVYIDKALPPLHLTTVERNTWFYKIAIKKMLCNRRHCKNIRIENLKNEFTTNAPKGSSFKESETGTIDVINHGIGVNNALNVINCGKVSTAATITKLKNQRDISITNSPRKSKIQAVNNIRQFCAANKRKRNNLEHLDPADEESEYSEDDRLVIQCSDPEEVSIKRIDHNHCDELEDRISNNIPPEQLPRKSHKQTLERRDSNEFSEQGMVIDCNNFNEHSEKNLELKDDTMQQQVLNIYNSVKNIEDRKLISYQDLQSSYESSNSTEESIEKTDMVIKENKKYFNFDDKNSNVSKSEHSMSSSRNATYRLWELKPEENCNSNAFKILIRTKVDACENNTMEAAGKKVQAVQIIPKLEYQCEFGAECLTQDEAFAQWTKMLFNPQSKLVRVRLDPIRSEIMMFESISYQEAMQQLEGNSRDSLDTLYHVLQALMDLEPGSYMLSHNKKLGTFATIRQADPQGRCSLQSVYSFDPFAAPSYEQYPWNQIDRNVTTPFHRSYGRVPATFPPDPNAHLGKTKKRNKKKNKKNKKCKSLSNSTE